MIISNSETDLFLGCQRAHYYKFGLGLSPKTMSRALHIGLLGHQILESFYIALKDGASRLEAISTAMDELNNAYEYETPDVVNVVSNCFIHYIRQYDDDSWRIIDVERVYRIPLTEEITFGFTIDLLIEYVKGPYRGQLVVVDHKFKYNFPTTDELSMHTQLYKYMWGLQRLGYPVTHGLMNVLRYREDIVDKNKLFGRYELRPQGDQLKNIMGEHLAVAGDIYEVKSQPVAWYREHARRRLNGRDCAYCAFRVPCRQSLIGIDESRTLTSMFTPGGNQGPYKPYGYEEVA